VKKLPSRNWGALKSTSPPARDWGAPSRDDDRGQDSSFGSGQRQSRGGNRRNNARGRDDRERGSRAGSRSGNAEPHKASGFGLKSASTEQAGATPSTGLPRRQWGAASGPAAQADQLAKGEPASAQAPVVEGDGVGEGTELLVDEDDAAEFGSSRQTARSRRRALEADHAKLERDAEGVAFNRGPKRTAPTVQEQRYIDAMNEKQEREARRKQKEQERRRMAQREEKKVMIPSNVTVARLATIFGRKIGEFHNGDRNSFQRTCSRVCRGSV